MGALWGGHVMCRRGGQSGGGAVVGAGPCACPCADSRQRSKGVPTATPLPEFWEQMRAKGLRAVIFGFGVGCTASVGYEPERKSVRAPWRGARRAQ